jgi:hypothetical protein
LCFNKTDEEDDVMKMVNGEMPFISSRLEVESKGFERALLEAVVANLATSCNAIETYATQSSLNAKSIGKLSAVNSTVYPRQVSSSQRQLVFPQHINRLA